MQISIVFILSVALSLVGCSSSTPLATGAGSGAKDTAPGLAFQRYWDASRERDLGQVDDLTSEPPLRFYLCQSISRVECDKKLSDGEKRRLEAESRGETIYQYLTQTDYSMIRTNVPDGIATGFWVSYVIKHQDIVENEARLSIAVTVKALGSPVDRDVLLYKTEQGWKIFEVTDPEAYEFYAAD